MRKKIPEAEIPPDKVLLFSFKHLECDHHCYDIEACDREYWQTLARELKRYSGMLVDEFTHQNNDDARHTVDFSDTDEREGFDSIAAEFDFSEAWQFAIGDKSRGWRVIGLLVKETFMVIWLASKHELYTKSSRRK